MGAVHRKHHACVETPTIPQPEDLRIRKIYWKAPTYRSGPPPGDLDKYGFGTPDDWIERNRTRRTPKRDKGSVGAAGPVRSLGLTIWAIQMLWIPVWAAGVVNGLGHYWGIATSSATTLDQHLPVGILIGGEELHNNHHALRSARLATVVELDSAMYIRTFELLGLARARSWRRGGYTPGKALVDCETVTAIVTSHLPHGALRREVVRRVTKRSAQAEGSARAC